MSPSPASVRPVMPPDVYNTHIFQFFNTFAWSMVLGTPMMLYFKQLDASATVLGVALALSPLLNIMQIPAARFVEHVGYRRFVLRGWGSRSLFTLGMVVVAFVPPDAISPTVRIGLLLFLLFGFNLLRGISVCGFMPWISRLVPENVRGVFLARDQMAGGLALLINMFGVSLFLKQGSTPWHFGILFLISFLASLASLLFLQRIPDVPTDLERRRAAGEDAESPMGIPWGAMLAHDPFTRILWHNFVVQVAYAASGIFWLPLLRDRFHADDGWIMGVVTLASLSQLVTFTFSGRLLDRAGSRPLMAVAAIIHIVHFCCWAALAAGFIPFGLGSIFVIQLTAGVGGGLFQLANTRLVMATVPEMGRSHFFALHSVVNNLTLGVFPVFWGYMIDVFKHWDVPGIWSWNIYSLLYLLLAVILSGSFFLLARLRDPGAMSTAHFLNELLVRTPASAISRLLQRRPPF